MRNAVITPLTAEQELIIASDNSAAIGEKPKDMIQISNKTVGYYACRVAMMELLAVKGEPHTIVMHNFTDDQAWVPYKKGILQVLSELGFSQVMITGSTESNFPTTQSGVSLTIIGTRPRCEKQIKWIGTESFAVIGTPLIGAQVIEQAGTIAPLYMFNKLCQMKEVIEILPVGSKGIQFDWQSWTGKSNDLICELDVQKSAGPATCFMISFHRQDTSLLKQITGPYFHKLTW